MPLSDIHMRLTSIMHTFTVIIENIERQKAINIDIHTLNPANPSKIPI